MKSLKEIIESLFDTQVKDGISKVVDKDLSENFLSKCKGNFKSTYLKDGSVKIDGKLIISDISGEGIYLKCKEFKGQLIIENCPNLKTFEGSFLSNTAVFKGSITINQCPSLESLSGLPSIIDGNLSITNCKKLKDIEPIKSVFGNLFWNRNGKKLTSEEILKKVNVLKKVFCSVEDEYSNINENINESLNNQWVQLLADQLKKYTYKEYYYDDKERHLTLDNLFKKYALSSQFSGRFLDKITNEDVDVYDMSSEKDKKELSKFFYNTYSARNANAGDLGDLILVFNEDLGEFVECYGNTTGKKGQFITCVKIPSSKTSGKILNPGYWTKSDTRDELLRYGIGYLVIVIKTGKETGSGDRWKLQDERRLSREGMITPGDVEQYKKIAAANIKRYKEIIAKNKINKKSESGEYEKISDEFEKIMLRVIKLTRMIAKNPQGYQKYDVDSFLQWVKDEKRSNPNYRYGRRGGSAYFGEYGLMYMFNSYISSYMVCFGKGYYREPNKDDYEDLNKKVKALQDCFNLADQKLKKFGV